MHLCVSSGIHSKRPDGSAVPFPETLAFLADAGFEEVDYGFTTPDMIRDDWKEHFLSFLSAARKQGIRVRYVHLPFDYPSEKTPYGWEEFRLASLRAMEMAVFAEADCGAIHPRTFMTRDYDPVREHDEALAFLSFYVDAAVKAGFPPALENMRGPGQSAPKEILRYCTETEDVIRLADELGIGICWDTGHGNISGQDQEASLRKIGSRLKMVHVNDNYAEDDIHIAPFVGKVNWDGFVRGLKAVSYNGSLNLEVGCNRLPEPLRKPYAAYMAASARQLVKALEG